VRVGHDLRTQIVFRAAGRCEYCLIHEDDAAFPHEVDDVIGRQHGGPTEAGNLALSCLYCNRSKGSNLASVDSTGVLVRLFDPRRDRWRTHFRIEGAVIQPLTPVGTVTARLLKLNTVERVIERSLLQGLGRYPRF
jgi:hypothetical protein